MGVVDLAERPDGTRWALKRLALHGTAAEMQTARTRLDREVAVLRQLQHPAIVPLIDAFDDGGELVLVMPYLEGGNLAERVQADGPRSADAVRALATRLLPALAAAHRAGIIHRDIKPANVLFDGDGVAYLADFGIASTRDTTGGLTQTGTVLGTPGFLSPEQARGEPVTPAADIAALGATLHFAATGRSPYAGGDAPAVLLRTARSKASIDRAITGDLRRDLQAMLDPRPTRRPTAARLAGGAGDTQAIPTMAGRRRWAIGAAAAAAVIAVGLGVAINARSGEDSTDLAATTTTSSCTAQPFHPCGGPVAPNTDGSRCVGDTADYDEVASNGCEAEPDTADGTELIDRIAANLVPAADTDEYPLTVADAGDVGCNNTLRVQIVAPAGTAVRLELHDADGAVLGETVSADGVAGEIAVRDPRCFRSDDGTYTAVVTSSGSDRSADNYVLTRTGGF